MTTRRNFVKKAGAGLLAASAVPLLVGQNSCTNSAPQKDPDAKFNLSVAGYTFAKFDIDETLEVLQQLDLHYLCIKDFHLPMTSTDEEIAAFKAKLAAKNVTGYAAGPIYMKTEAETDAAFDYARRVGVKLIVGVPNHEMLPYVEKKVKEYDFRYAIHNHGPDIDLYPNATDVMKYIKDLDPRIGLCLDIGHTVRDGLNPIADIENYHDRLFDMHLNDATGAGKSEKICIIGRGVIDIPLLVRTLKKIGYAGACSMETGTENKEDTVRIVAESAGYFKGVVTALK